MFVIDHNLAFDDICDDEFENHIFSPKNRNWRLDWVDKDIFTDKAIEILNDFDDICDNIPDEWLPIDSEEYQKFEAIIIEIKAILARINTKDYWDNIK
ncbi:hypothetical protein QJU98_07715 [Pasteurella skyensis]|uniref:HipA-like kinase domain-containing protein n=1 Tax=Phocoenobacter skyensis TaxID=97481 RepID=A0ABT9JLS0_9PAST|nr:HipA family kinase [Pasteurella skyensis]MDP8079767.1 hypothetical protein [Pasteurella skyensis]MDP8085764.1 hypothetical protein [Pasteurella skyensis]MDP8185592.1 hypothetical protein [Pasteurella skyensis]QLB21848.1 hypothetical protein A6B44_00930 [Pasteurella skyensis]